MPHDRCTLHGGRQVCVHLFEELLDTWQLFGRAEVTVPAPPTRHLPARGVLTGTHGVVTDYVVLTPYSRSTRAAPSAPAGGAVQLTTCRARAPAGTHMPTRNGVDDDRTRGARGSDDAEHTAWYPPHKSGTPSGRQHSPRSSARVRPVAHRGDGRSHTTTSSRQPNYLALLTAAGTLRAGVLGSTHAPLGRTCRAEARTASTSRARRARLSAAPNALTASPARVVALRWDTWRALLCDTWRALRCDTWRRQLDYPPAQSHCGPARAATCQRWIAPLRSNHSRHADRGESARWCARAHVCVSVGGGWRGWVGWVGGWVGGLGGWVGGLGGGGGGGGGERCWGLIF
jgi:hypothetical protein